MARSDEVIKRDILDEMYWDHRVDTSEVKVQVEGGKAILSGTVPSYSAKIAAENDCWMIRDVNAVNNQLFVKFPETYAPPSDDEVQTNAMHALAWNPDVYSLDIFVSVESGVVKLEGTVDSYWKHQKAEDLVSELRGVIDVENLLTVVPSGDFMDKEIARDIENALERNIYVDAEEITVSVEDGIATLSGTVPTNYSHNKAYSSAAFTPGVVEVEDELVIV